MAWNEPGGSKDKDPWGGRGKEQGPPDLDEIVRKVKQKLNGVFGDKGGKGTGGDGPAPIRGGGNSANGIGIVILALVGAWFLYDMVHIIQPAERGVVLRFGGYVDTMQPGLNFRLPRPFENVIRVNVAQNRDVLIGYRASGSDRGAKSATVPSEARMLTRDENIVDVRFAIQYNIKSASDYVFKVKDPDLTLREATESAIREIVGKSDMDFVLKEGRSDIVDRVKVLIQKTLDNYGAGLMIISVNMQDAQPPTEVQHSFDDAVKAREDQQRVINEAEAYSNDVLPRARGAAARQIEEASAYKEQVVAQADGEAQRFERILTEYKKAPEVTRQRLYIETMEQVLSNSSKVMIDVQGGNNMIYLPLDKMMGSSSSSPSVPSAGGTGLNALPQESQSSSVMRSAEQFIQQERESLRGREKR
jgi:membrane protease subunit HflK